MENMWQFNVEESSQESPKAILEEQAKLLPSLTGDMVYATVTDVSSAPYTDFRGDFMYSFVIKSKFLPNYGYRVLTISHNIPIYPVKVLPNRDIREEIGLDMNIQANDDAEFKKILRQVLSSKQISSVINSIIKLSK